MKAKLKDFSEKCLDEENDNDRNFVIEVNGYDMHEAASAIAQIFDQYRNRIQNMIFKNRIPIFFYLNKMFRKKKFPEKTFFGKIVFLFFIQKLRTCLHFA